MATQKPARTAIPIFLLLVFVGFGDKFLPEPLKGASLTTRTTINRFVLGLVPSWHPKTQPYDRTEKALEQTEKGAGGQ